MQPNSIPPSPALTQPGFFLPAPQIIMSRCTTHYTNLVQVWYARDHNQGRALAGCPALPFARKCPVSAYRNEVNMLDAATIQTYLAAILTAAVLIASVMAWRWFKVWSVSATLRQEQDALTQVGFYAAIFVAAAEQMLWDKAGADKLTWVLDQIHAQLPDIDTALVRAFVEAAVLRTPSPGPSLPVPVNCDDLAPAKPAVKPAVSGVTGKK